jgi:hypothetical protein
MFTTFESRTLSIRINCPLDQAYGFVSAPENFPQWASGLGASIRQAGDAWIAETPAGPVQVRFTAPNDFGVLDHYVVLDSGEEVYIPMRAIANGDGCEIVFTLFRLPVMSDEKFAADIAWVQRDLQALKTLLEAA